jgi:hypothetical protein
VLPEHVRVLFDRYQLVDIAIKVVGVGSVGTVCLIGLFMAGDGDRCSSVQAARASVLEPYAGNSLHKNHGERSSSIATDAVRKRYVPGLTIGSKSGQHLRAATSRHEALPIIEGFDAVTLQAYAEVCSWALARAHARSGDAAMISGYIGSCEVFDEAICEFSVEYADQNEHDYKAFVTAVREGKIKALVES